MHLVENDEPVGGAFEKGKRIVEEGTMVRIFEVEVEGMPGLTDLARFLARDPDAPPLQPAEWRYLPWPPPA